MDNKETHKGRRTADILLYNEEYFKYIFKKTEKIVAAVFYTTRSINDIDTKDTVLSLLEEKARTLLDVCEKTLRAPEMSRKLRLEELRIALIGLESALVVGNGARLIPYDLLEVFRHEMNSVHRLLREYSKDQMPNPLEEPFTETPTERPRRRTLPLSGAERTPTQQESASATPQRHDRILQIIKEKGHASIKDISTLITDCSEKTIQRELMALIAKGQIVREGERRWSKYSLAV